MTKNKVNTEKEFPWSAEDKAQSLIDEFIDSLNKYKFDINVEFKAISFLYKQMLLRTKGTLLKSDNKTEAKPIIIRIKKILKLI